MQASKNLAQTNGAGKPVEAVAAVLPSEPMGCPQHGGTSVFDCPCAYAALNAQLRDDDFWARERENTARLRVAKALERQATELEGQGASAPSSAEAADAWIKAWLASRERRGLTATRDVRGHISGHIVPAIGADVARWTRADMRKLSAALDAKVQEGAISGKTALNVWATATRMTKDAASSKIEALRVREDNPARDVPAPDRVPEKARQYLYPSEFSRFLACGRVPMLWRRAVTVATYLGCRDGELRVLEWGDVDLDHCVVHVTRAWDRRAECVKPTKTGHTRRFAIEPALLPVLRAMRDECGGSGVVVPLPSERDMARGFRRWLKHAGVDRAELHLPSATSQTIRFHDLRATCATWMIVRGDTERRVMARTGHLDRGMLDRYVRVAESVAGADFGEPFPALPANLCSAQPTAADGLASAADGSAEPADGIPVLRTSGADGTRTRETTQETAEPPPEPPLEPPSQPRSERVRQLAELVLRAVELGVPCGELGRALAEAVLAERVDGSAR